MFFCRKYVFVWGGRKGDYEKDDAVVVMKKLK